MFLRAINVAAEYLAEKKEEQEEVDTVISRKAQFTISYGGDMFRCEECDCVKFIKLSKIKVKCIRCDAVYNVAFKSVDIDIVFYEG